MGDVQKCVLDQELVRCGKYVEFCLLLGMHAFVYPHT